MSHVITSVLLQNIRLKSVQPALHAKIQQLTRQLTDLRIVCDEAQAHRDALEKRLQESETSVASCNQRHLHEVQALTSQVQTLTSELQRLTEENAGLRTIARRSAYAKDSCEDKVLAAMSHLSMSDMEARHFLQVGCPHFPLCQQRCSKRDCNNAAGA
jgi:predicted RNase H-like nuclease (RuvC/YqgF family)